MKDLNRTPSASFGQKEGVEAYHTLVREKPQSRDKRVEDIAVYALNGAMMAAGKTAQDIDRGTALNAILVTVDEQTISGTDGYEAG